MTRPSLLAVVGQVCQQPTLVLLDKSSFCGGDSTVATGGINGVNTRTQRERCIRDSGELFTSATLKGSEKKPELAKVS